MRVRELPRENHAVPLHPRFTLVHIDRPERGSIVAAIESAVRAELDSETPIEAVLRPARLAGMAAPASESVAAPALETEQLEREIAAARARLDPEAEVALSAAEAELAASEAALAAARSQAEASAQEDADARARRERRAELLGEIARAEKEADTTAVKEALDAVRRLGEVKPRPSPRAAALADRWEQYQARQRGDLPDIEPPPEYMVAPARAALEAARHAVAEAERASGGAYDYPREAVQRVEQAHRALLEAEQRLNTRPSRLNRRRLDSAKIAEREAIAALGVSDYPEYLQKVVPATRRRAADRDLASARAALEDAEAVWEELHEGVPPMTDEELAAQFERLRTEARELLERDVSEDELVDALRSHLEPVVEVGWARDNLREALLSAGAEPSSDLESVADDWLRGAPERVARLSTLRSELEAMGEIPEDTGEPPPDSSAVADAEVAVESARRAREEAVVRKAQSEAAAAEVAELEHRLARQRAAHDEEAARDRAMKQATEGAPLDIVMYVIARAAGHRGVARGPVPLVVDDAFAELSRHAQQRLLELLVRIGAGVQTIYVTASPELAEWGRQLPEADGALLRLTG